MATEGGEQVASATAAATSKAKQESEQLWLAEKEVLMSMMEEKETQVRQCAEIHFGYPKPPCLCPYLPRFERTNTGIRG